MRLGEHFLKQQIIDEEQIKKALEIQAETGGKIGEILFAISNMRAINYYTTLAKFYDIPFVDLLKSLPETALLDNNKKEAYFKNMCLPIRHHDGIFTVATAEPSPDQFQAIKDEYGDQTKIVCTSKFDILWTLQKQFNTKYIDTAIHELSNSNSKMSADYKSPLWLRLLYCVPIIGLGVLFFFNAKIAVLGLNIAILLGLTVVVTFKIGLSIIGVCLLKKPTPTSTYINQDDLPVYSILIPLYQENEITLTNLFSHLQKIIYPAHKLDIKVLLEEDDTQTIAIAKKLNLPSYIEYIYVPTTGPRTKAKACNYGLQFARGKYLCLYDAEDKPDPDQLLRALDVFNQSCNENLACVQCKLNFYNSDENWLTRLFTVEYTYWFDLLLPALTFTGIPIPLGGTSNHFRTDTLKKAIAWDPFNVTEDADLGLRLSRLGYITTVLDSTTYEEANCQLWNWIKQRTRWIKGYMQTYLVHMRSPIAFWKKIGGRGFLGFQLFIGGTSLSNLTNLPMWIISLYLLLAPTDAINYYFPGNVKELAILNLIAGTFGITLLNAIGVYARKKPRLIFSALSSPAYWMLMSIASYRALYQLIFKPNYWDKTQHGISNVFKTKIDSNKEKINIKKISVLSGVKFGTSGLRAYNHNLTDLVCYEFTEAFLKYLEEKGKIIESDKVILAGDLRENTEHIIKVITKSVTENGYHVEYCGKVPTPALAYYCSLRNAAGIMVTGSHIPADMNGIKFYTKDGEILKEDEEGILDQTIAIDSHLFNHSGTLDPEQLYITPISDDAMHAFLNRYLNFFSNTSLKGLRIGIYKHSSVAADILATLLKQLGAEVFPFGESKQFYSLDTEALSDFDNQIVRKVLIENNLDTVVSTDGDADRPLVTNEHGHWIRGDMLGMLCAMILNAEYIVTPISSNSSVEFIPSVIKVYKTKIGSPYVIEKINELRREGKQNIIGYEANGGVLIGTDIVEDNKTLAALPTRDSIIPIISILAYANTNQITLSELVRHYAHTFTYSASIKPISNEQIHTLFSEIMRNNTPAINLQTMFNLQEQILKVDLTDGIRATLSNKCIIHLRGSGNSPELRCYTEANSPELAKRLNEDTVNMITTWSKHHENSVS